MKALCVRDAERLHLLQIYQYLFSLNFSAKMITNSFLHKDKSSNVESFFFIKLKF